MPENPEQWGRPLHAFTDPGKGPQVLEIPWGSTILLNTVYESMFLDL